MSRKMTATAPKRLLSFSATACWA